MDLTTLMSALLSDNSISSVSGKTGATNDEVASVLASALPTLLSGANAQAQNEETSQSFHEALNEHAQKDPETVEKEEGEKIVQHLLGDNTSKVEKEISKKTGISKAKVALILALVAPLIMNKLGSTTSPQSSNANSTANLIGSLLGGGNSNTMNSALTSVLTAAMLGSLANGASSQSQAPATSILGSLLGAGVPQQQYQTQQHHTQQQVMPSSTSLLGSLLGAGMPQQQQQQNQGPDLGSALGLLTSLLK